MAGASVDVTVTTYDGRETRHTYPVEQTGEVGKYYFQRVSEQLEETGLMRWRYEDTSRGFGLDNPMTLYNGNFVVSVQVDICIMGADESTAKNEIRERIGFLAAVNREEGKVAGEGEYS